MKPLGMLGKVSTEYLPSGIVTIWAVSWAFRHEWYRAESALMKDMIGLNRIPPSIFPDGL